MYFFIDSWNIFVRQIRGTLRAPTFIVLSIVQPILWLLLFGQLFGAITQISGFGSSTYIQFLAPGLAIMIAILTATYAGLGLILDLDSGVLNRFLTTAVNRGAIIFGRLGDVAIQAVIQAVILLLAAFLLGARPVSGLPGALLVLLATALFSCSLGALSKALALVVRRQDALMGLLNFLVLPLMFTSSMMMTSDLMPGWIRAFSRFNPVDWAVQAARLSFEGRGLQESGVYFALLVGLAAFSSLLAIAALKSYERSQ